ncbi:glutamine synthetase 1, mitochondrial-like [Cydia amplana]|uniref:glutamine synthetase 1, mitochondrial-like n=1 Tax=Cydia amplana TaxID=1869771 RepID=UPI002FE50A6F
MNSIILKSLLNYKSRDVVLLCRRNLMAHNINHIMSKKVMDRYMRLPWPCNKILATYCWIDGSGINLRCKDRILSCMPYSADAAPEWAFDGSSTGQASTENSDTKLLPAAVCRDPFRMEPHVLVLSEVYLGDNKPSPTNHRNFCNSLCEAHKDQDPWFGLEQEYAMLDVDGWGLGWPKGGGFPAVKYEYSYCGVGAKYISGRDVSEAHTRACLYAGLDFEGTNAEVMFCSWEFQIGTTTGIKAPDHIWLARYIMARVAEEYGVQITYHPKPMGMKHPGSGMHHNFSTKKMRTAPGGYKFIEECIKKLEKNHKKHMSHYQMSEAANRMRLSGQFETAPFDEFRWGIADRKSSIRLQRRIKEKDAGFMEDRRPSADCDPYMVCGLLLDTCLGSAGGGGSACPPNPCKK